MIGISTFIMVLHLFMHSRCPSSKWQRLGRMGSTADRHVQFDSTVPGAEALNPKPLNPKPS